MAAKVIDASAVGALIFVEPQRREIADRIRDSSLIAPTLLPFEVTNTCVKKMRRHPEDREEYVEAFGLLATLPIELVEVDHQGVLKLAEEFRLSAYDASYLWLSRRYSAELVTLDRRLAAASAR